MRKWVAEFELEDGDTMPEHMDLNYMGAKIDFHCRPMWIPVSKPPEYPGEFLCYYDVEEFGEVMHCIDFGRYDEDDGWCVSGVKYWMPLPDEPYERSEE